MASSISKFLNICTSVCTQGAPILERHTTLAPKYVALVRHDPGLKRKKKHKIDPKKKQKKTSNIAKKPIEVLPPVDPEAFVDRALFETERRRDIARISDEERERRILLLKEWSKYRNEMQRNELRKLQEVISSRDLALRELKKISLWHYEEAIKTDEQLFPLKFKGPTETPPIVNYIAPDTIE